MSIINEKQDIPAARRSCDEKLFLDLSETDFANNGYSVSELGSGICALEQSICGWWKQRYLIDKNNCRAFEIMDENMRLMFVSKDDIDWESIAQLPESIRMRANALSARFPSFIHGFKNGVALVSWQLNPEGRYYMDEDGYGMTSDDEVTIYGFIDTCMNVLVKFRYINDDWTLLNKMRDEAQSKLK